MCFAICPGRRWTSLAIRAPMPAFWTSFVLTTVLRRPWHTIVELTFLARSCRQSLLGLLIRKLILIRRQCLDLRSAILLALSWTRWRHRPRTVSATGTGDQHCANDARQARECNSHNPDAEQVRTDNSQLDCQRSILPPASNDPQSVKARREVVARAVSSVSQTRVWNLLIDLVAQTGHYPPNAQGLDDFIVEGEKRYWLHVAIDRFEGSGAAVKVLGQQLEEVTE